jgi:hypothetical protein
MANDVIYQPNGIGTEVKNGTIIVMGPLGAVSGVVGSDYTIDTYVSNLPTTGTVYNKYKDRFDDYTYYSA